MIEIRNLNFSYSKKKPILKNVNLNLQSGNIFGLLGKNGAGKSTLLKNIAGLLFPRQGTVTVFGYHAHERLPQFLREIYIIPEEFSLPAFTIKKYVDIYAVFYPRFSQEQFYHSLEEFKLNPKEKLTTLSYGQKKKVIIGFGLASNCNLLLMDEPTNGLDIPSKSQFRKIVAAAATEERCFIISTHQVKDVENLIDPIIILDQGEIIFHQTFENVSKRLAFAVQQELVEDEQVVYAQSVLGGYSVVTENRTGEEGSIDLEILFNSITSGTDKINQIFKN